MKGKFIGIFICVLLMTTVVSVIGQPGKYNPLTLHIRGVPGEIFTKNTPTIFGCPTLGEIIDQQQTTRGGLATAISVSDVAQSFKPSIDSLTKISIPIFRKGTIPDDIIFTVSIRAELEGDDITSYEISRGQYPGNLETEWITCDVPDITVIPEQTYFIVCTASGTLDPEMAFICWSFGPDLYERGEAWSANQGSGSWRNHEDKDQCFITYGFIDNDLPQIPETPSGPSNGKPGEMYTFTTVTTDPDNDEVFYLWDWGDGSDSGWLGPYESGVTCEEQHAWPTRGRYEIKVKSKDSWGQESDWSDPLSITIPKSKTQNLFMMFFESLTKNHPYLFPIVKNLLHMGE